MKKHYNITIILHNREENLNIVATDLKIMEGAYIFKDEENKILCAYPICKTIINSIE